MQWRWRGRWKHIYDVNPAEAWWAASDIGWVVGHSYIVYAPLIVGATTVLYEGKPVARPTPAPSGEWIEEHGVVGLFTAPPRIRAIKREDPSATLLAEYDISTLRTLFVAGERLDPDTYAWAGEHLGVPVVDNWWQTETGWADLRPARADSKELPLKAGSAVRYRCPATTSAWVDENGLEVEPGTDGCHRAIRLPLPPGNLPIALGGRRAASSRDLPVPAFPATYLDRRRRPPGRGRLPCS